MAISQAIREHHLNRMIGVVQLSTRALATYTTASSLLTNHIYKRACFNEEARMMAINNPVPGIKSYRPDKGYRLDYRI